MGFRTKLDYSNNRQIKQHIETLTVLSGATNFGVPFNTLPVGPNLLTTGETETYLTVASTFSGNSGTTNYTWFHPAMEYAISGLSALTPSISAITQTTIGFSGNSYTVIDGNSIALGYSGATFDLLPIAMYDLGGGNYSGTVYTQTLDILSATTLDFTGRTIWADVSGITRTEDLIITRNPVIGNVWTCIDSEGKGAWTVNSSGGSGSDIWITSIGANSAIISGSSSVASGVFSIAFNTTNTASGINSVAQGFGSIASGNYSHAEGSRTTASGEYSHAEGLGTIASGFGSHAEGGSTTASGDYSHAEGSGCQAIGQGSHAEGSITQAVGDFSHAQGNSCKAYGSNSHAGGSGVVVSGITSFNHSHSSASTSTVAANYSAILGGVDNLLTSAATRSVILGGFGLTGTTSSTVYVPSLNINNVPAGPGTVDIGVDANGTVVNQASDIRLKENINTIDNALNRVLNLRGVTYNWKDRERGGNALKIGFIAQEVKSVIPELVFQNTNDDYMGVHYKDIPALLVEAIKELVGATAYTNTILETQTIVAEDNNIELNFNGTDETSIGGGIKVLRGNSETSELILNENGDWVTNNSFKANSLIIPTYTPTSTNDENGILDSITKDDNYLYIKTTDGWKRTNLENF